MSHRAHQTFHSVHFHKAYAVRYTILLLVMNLQTLADYLLTQEAGTLQQQLK